jgi:hypothetical protein
MKCAHPICQLSSSTKLPSVNDFHDVTFLYTDWIPSSQILAAGRYTNGCQLLLQAARTSCGTTAINTTFTCSRRNSESRGYHPSRDVEKSLSNQVNFICSRNLSVLPAVSLGIPVPLTFHTFHTSYHFANSALSFRLRAWFFR